MTDRPFSPFHPLEHVFAPVHAWELAESTLSRALAAPPRVAVVSGPMGVGKSSFLRTRARAVAEAGGWRTVLLPAHILSSEQEALAIVASALGHELRGLEALVRRKAATSQIADEITDSDHVRVTQVFAHASAHAAERATYVAGTLAALAGAAEQGLCFMVDQVEVAWLTEPVASLAVLGAIIDLAAVPDLQVACVLGIRDRFIGDLLLALRHRLPSIGGNIAMLAGLPVADAREYARSALGMSGMTIPSSTLTRMLREVTDESSGLVWPVALQAALDYTVRQRTEKRKSQRPIRRSAILADAVASRLRSLDPTTSEDALFILYGLARSCVVAGPQTTADMERALPVIPSSDLRRGLAALAAVGLVEEIRVGVFAPAHDSLLRAVLELRATALSETELAELDAVISDWHLEGRPVPDGALRQLVQRRASELPSPHAVCLSAAAFDAWFLGSKSIAEAARAVASLVPIDQTTRLLRARAQRVGRRASLSPPELFVVLCATEGDGSQALESLVSLSELGTDWSEPDLVRALVASKDSKLFSLLCAQGCASVPAPVSRVILNARLQLPLEPVDDSALELLWSSRAGVELEVLRVLRLYRPPWLGEAALVAVESEDAVLVSAALTALVAMRPDGWESCVRAHLTHADVEIRRRGAYSLSGAGEVVRRFDLAAVFRNETAQVVREALLEVAADLPVDVGEELVQAGLNDESEIVRESAVYALRSQTALWDVVRLAEVERDPSPLVREALLHLYRDRRQAPPEDLVLRDARMGPMSLRVAAVGLLQSMEGSDAAVRLGDVLVDDTSPLPVRIAALHSARLLADPRLASAIAESVQGARELELLAAAVDALEAIGDQSSQDVLAVLTRHPTADVRERAVYALARLGGQGAVAALMKCVLDPEPAVQARALFGLGRLNSFSAVGIAQMLPRRTPDLDRAIDWYLDRFSEATRDG